MNVHINKMLIAENVGVHEKHETIISACQELGELAQAVTKFYGLPQGDEYETARINLAEEMADTLIIICNCMLCFGVDDTAIQAQINYKQARQHARNIKDLTNGLAD